MDQSGKAKPVDDKAHKSYLRLMGIYEGDVEVGNDKEKPEFVQTFLFHFVDAHNMEYLAPVTCHEVYKDGVRKQLQRLKPLVLFLEDKMKQETNEMRH